MEKDLEQRTKRFGRRNGRANVDLRDNGESDETALMIQFRYFSFSVFQYLG
jgi:hypothetical protein